MWAYYVWKYQTVDQKDFFPGKTNRLVTMVTAMETNMFSSCQRYNMKARVYGTTKRTQKTVKLLSVRGGGSTCSQWVSSTGNVKSCVANQMLTVNDITIRLDFRRLNTIHVSSALHAPPSLCLWAAFPCPHPQPPPHVYVVNTLSFLHLY